MANASPVPVIRGVRSRVIGNESIVGGTGVFVSTVEETTAEAGLTLSAGSVWFARMAMRPSVNPGPVTARDQEPSAATSDVPISTSNVPSLLTSAMTVTVAFGSPVPVIIGVGVLMNSGSGSMTGATGAVRSISISASITVPTLPAALP